MATFIAGYSLVWVSLVAYVGWIGLRQRRLARQYEMLRKQVEQNESHRRREVKAA